MVMTAAMLLPPLLFYGGYDFAANRLVEEHDLPRAMRNGVRHALASGSVYDAVRRVGLGRQAAESLILSLGNINERIETQIKIGSPDSPAEIRKDLHNNWAGVAAAEWRMAHGSDESLGSIIAELARSETLMLHRMELPGQDAENKDKVAHAQLWLDARKQDVTTKVIDQLNRPSRREQSSAERR